MKQVLHKADSRGLADCGWLLSRHTFSFADYYDPERMGFGLLRVLNDDIVKPAMGFGTHPHENMEIVSIPLSGSLRHQDSMGNKHVIAAGEVQVMSAGSGITHSEYNNSEQEEVNFLQIWVHPKERNIAPRYGQLRFDPHGQKNRFQILVAPEKNAEAIWINQDAWFSLAMLDVGSELCYRKQRLENGVYFFVISGALTIAGQSLEARDGLGICSDDELIVQAAGPVELLVIEVPMNR
ncbi:pirin family protein [Malonomonas rubra]|uniref:pirin family protein n=1 Tax=Malonomonas rubra TaxID=57040 RepID=UPI0026F003AF|nr:pirin family protein [Malonomonas rubra]